ISIFVARGAVASTADQVLATTMALGGQRVAASTARRLAPDRLALSVPADRVDDVLREIRELGEVGRLAYPRERDGRDPSFVRVSVRILAE
nr:hypothetical protein [Actinomycetota bacterium]